MTEVVRKFKMKQQVKIVKKNSGNTQWAIGGQMDWTLGKSGKVIGMDSYAGSNRYCVEILDSAELKLKNWWYGESDLEFYNVEDSIQSEIERLGVQILELRQQKQEEIERLELQLSALHQQKMMVFNKRYDIKLTKYELASIIAYVGLAHESGMEKAMAECKHIKDSGVTYTPKKLHPMYDTLCAHLISITKEGI